MPRRFTRWTPKTADTLAERFWSKVNPPGCWEWTGARRGKGYGEFGLCPVSGVHTVEDAHRVAWSMTRGQPVPAGASICHTCDNPPCVRPDHLFLGSPALNTQDMDRKGRRRNALGDEKKGAKLTRADVALIRRVYVPGKNRWQTGNGRDLCIRFGVHRSVISRIVGRKWWRWVE